MDVRICSKVACANSASSTLTYDYGDSMVVVGPLSNRVEPHGYDLCARHAATLRVPRGWQVVRREPLPRDAD
ncbi:DUF3499 domain-containing protein [Curtobacterium sp. MCLR17_039]|uniref:DUF3499 family protein n=1 Tax=Curtobacterium sp. MCLR17_039 TaxID=2175624 RepID=UPI000DA83E0A|nr:DUF3499 family protein [Curtobacterium sp. MCLR17_039]PZE93697.1 DUF3499 domain-containing protein [Curtobacterium sp. MCLR17_039]